jgi:hypothetical protein
MFNAGRVPLKACPELVEGPGFGLIGNLGIETNNSLFPHNENRVVWATRPAPDIPIYGFGMGQNVFLQVGRLTNPFTKQVNCVAAAAYPFIPGPKPEDLEDLSGLGTDAGEKAAESAAGVTESAADQIKNAGRIGPSRAARIAKLEGQAKNLNRFAKGLSVAGYALATKEAVNNFRNCEGQK